MFTMAEWKQTENSRFRSCVISNWFMYAIYRRRVHGLAPNWPDFMHLESVGKEKRNVEESRDETEGKET